MKLDTGKLLISLIAPFVAAAIGSLATFEAIPTWYAGLNKPFFNPPNWIFGPVWTILYLLQGIALYLFWSSVGDVKARGGLRLFRIQLVLNALWSVIFFGLQQPLLAFGEIVMLWIFIFLTIKEFWSLKRVAAYLLIPYLAWVSFAAVLNLFIVVLN